MLKVWNYQNRLQIDTKLNEVDFEQCTWVLSDLRSKLEIQNRIFKKQGYSLDSYILRASDLWKTLLRKSQPEYEIIGQDYALLLTKNFLGQVSLNNENFNGLTEKNWLDQLSRWSHVVFDPEVKKQVVQYLAENLEIKNSIGREFLLAGLLADYFQYQKKILSSWCPSILQSQLSLNEVWKRPLWVDLRGELSQSEAELFHALSRHQDVHILRPVSDFENSYFNIVKPYDYLISKAAKVEDLDLSPHSLPTDEARPQTGPSKNSKVISFSGPLGEVKWTVAKVRQWLDAGVASEQIAIVAPDIETYWPCLKSYLTVEGIPTQKAKVSRLSTFPQVRQWMASLRSALNPLDYFSHEKHFFGSIPTTHVRYEDFRSQLFELYETADLGRMQAVLNFVQDQPAWPAMISRDEFLARGLQLWPLEKEVMSDFVKQALEKFLRETQVQLSASPQDWLQFLETIFTQTEIKIEGADEQGIQVTSLMSAWSQQLSHVIFVGMADENLKSQARFGLSPQESLALSRDLGLLVESVEQKYREYELRWWFQQRSQTEIFYLEPMTDWSGQLLNHSPLLLGTDKHLPSDFGLVVSRWDQLQNISLENIFESEQEKWHRLQEDLGERKMDLVPLQVKKLSPSAVENYLKCHFIFLAGRGFKLLDKVDIDIDIDRQKNGQFMHALVERLLQTAESFQLSDSKIQEILEQLRVEFLAIRAEDPTWLPRRNKFQKWSQRFLKNENNWSQEYPENKILKFEADWTVDLEFKDQVYNFRGRIDRIDGNLNRKEWLVLDYKSSSASLTSAASWLKNDQLQLLFYLWAIERKAVPDISGKALGAFYYSLKTLERQKGLRIASETPLLPIVKRKNAAMDPEKYQELLGEFDDLLQTIMSELSEGHFRPEPKDETECPTCPWNKVCRAPHLNL